MSACNSAGEHLVTLPERLQLTYADTADGYGQLGQQEQPGDEILRVLQESIPEELWSLRLGLKLLAEKAGGSTRGSPFQAYVDSLPERLPVPVFFSAEAVAALQYAPVVEQVKKRSRFLLDFAKNVVPAALGGLPAARHPFGGLAVGVSALAWAMGAASSRAFRMRGSAKPPSMLPVIDLSNHSFAPNARVQPSASGSGPCHLVALGAIVEGAPVVISYGELSNDFLLLDYGFVEANNPFDTLDLVFDLGMIASAQARAGAGAGLQCQPEDWQIAVLAKLKLLGGNSASVSVGGKEYVDGRLLAALRVLHAKDMADLRGCKRLFTHGLTGLQGWHADASLGNTNERRVLATLAALLDLLRESFPTSLAHDEGLVARGGLMEDVQLAMKFNAGKKRVLERVVAFIAGRRGAIADI
eukprot:SM000174S03354  [mRNA]  locus=s174:156929:159004:- [translate_table: standard]